jgi:hypothetical protein
MKTVRIGCASGFWGDSAVAAPQLVTLGRIDYLVFDYLAELTMSILARAKQKNPQLGYATDFPAIVMKGIVRDVAEKGIRVISNAGGLNPAACAEAVAAVAREAGVSLKIAVIEGDDLLPRIESFRAQGVRELWSGAALPKRVLSANAYLGGFPVAAALAAGAQVVITGRGVDSAVTLGALIHEFGWTADDLDLLAAGSLAGHLLECGVQATGGLHTDWESIPDIANIGYPIAECTADGGVVVTKPDGTGGRMLAAAVAEQLLYEVHDPANYILPDVVCDFSGVRIVQEDGQRVRVSGARGRAPTPHYKVAATYADGYRLVALLNIIGVDAARKGRRTGDAIIERTRRMLADAGLPDYRRTRVEVLGAEQAYGPHARGGHAREVVVRVAAEHDSREALEILSREVAPSSMWAPGTAGAGLGRQAPAPSVKMYGFLVPKTEVHAVLRIGAESTTLSLPVARERRDAPAPQTYGALPAPAADDCVDLPLIRLAWGRSGDKGDTSNIGIIARHPDFVPLLQHWLTAERVAGYFAYRVQGPVTRFDVPGIHAFNFVLERALGGGGMASLQTDPLGKAYAQMLLDILVPVPVSLVRAHRLLGY